MKGPSPFTEMALPEFAEIAGNKSIYEIYRINPATIPKAVRLAIWENGGLSMIPLLALYGEGVDLGERGPFLNFISTTPVGSTLALHASLAREGRTTWARFCHSIRQPGFVLAWFAFCESTRTRDNETVSEWVKRLRKLAGEPLDDLTRYLAEVARDSIPLPGTPEFEEFVADQARHHDSERKKLARRKPTKEPSLHRRIVVRDFLANALWCRSSSAIVSEYFPDSTADEHEKHERAFNKAFSILNLSKTRRADIPECPDIVE